MEECLPRLPVSPHLLLSYGALLRLQHKLDAARTQIDAALALIGEDNRPELLARALYESAVLAWLSRQFDEAAQLCTRALAAAQAHEAAAASIPGILMLRGRVCAALGDVVGSVRLPSAASRRPWRSGTKAP